MEIFACLVLIVAILVPLVVVIPSSYKGTFNLMCTAILSFAGVMVTLDALQNNIVQLPGSNFAFIGNLTLQADLLSAVFLAIISVSSLLVAIYSMGYMKVERGGARMNMYVIAFNYLVISMYLVCMVQNMIAFLIVWEIMSFSSFMLVIIEHEKLRSIRSGLNYLLQMHIGVGFLMCAVCLIFMRTGQAEFSSILHYCKDFPDMPVFLLFFCGLGFKLGIVPFHTWAPDAYAAAPPHISAFMSGAMKKLGIYGLIRVLTFIQDSQTEIGIFLIVVGSVSAMYGILNAVIQNDMKKSLAYSSIENIGIIILGLGIGFLGIGLQDYSLAYLGLCGSLLHVINHFMFKSLLFMAAGAVQNSTNMLNMNFMGGLVKSMPISSLLFLIASLSICGLPPFNGFISEFLLYGGIFEGLNASKVNVEVFLLIALITLALSGGLSIFNYSKMFGVSFLGSPRSDRAAQATETNYWIIAPQIVLVILILSVDLFPLKYINVLNNVVYMFVPNSHTFASRLFHSSQNIALITMVFLLIVLFLVVVRQLLVPKSKIIYGPTWGCGYTGKSTKLQYTSSSFSQLFMTYASPVIGFVKKPLKLEKEDVFPSNQVYETHSYDVLERNLVKKLVNKGEHLMQYFAFLQTGRLQDYLIYGFAFMLLLFLLTFSNII